MEIQYRIKEFIFTVLRRNYYLILLWTILSCIATDNGLAERSLSTNKRALLIPHLTIVERQNRNMTSLERVYDDIEGVLSIPGRLTESELRNIASLVCKCGVRQDIVDLDDYFYSLKDISIGGMCICYGHANECPTNPRTGRFQCKCEHNTAGKNCELCQPMYNQVEWKPGSNQFQCQECNCNGHANSCYYDDKVAKEHKSMNTRGQYIGGGVCQNCTRFTEGINCQSCVDGYYRPYNIPPNHNEPCVPCVCNQNGAKALQDGFYCKKTREDDSVGSYPGDCVCKEGYTGRKCERCAKGYTGFPNCHLCECSLSGSLNTDPCAGVCRCKSHVTGINCNMCELGFFNLQSTNAAGCEECFCSSATNACQDAILYRTVIETMDGWRLEARAGTRTTIPQVDATGKPYSDHQTTIKSLLTSIYYWSAPTPYLGNLLTSYGGNLYYTILYNVTDDAVSSPIQDVDVLIQGQKTTLFYKSDQYSRVSPGQEFRFTIPLVADGNWIESYSRNPVTKSEMLATLSSVKTLLIRAVYNRHPIARYSIYDIKLDSASPNVNGERVHTVEICHCPQGYTGLSCEECSPGYYRQGNKCIQCNCHGHSASCNIHSGSCQYCQHNTMGMYCERCMLGYYGDATRGTPSDCQKCACPLETSSNNFSPTCMMDELDDTMKCLECPIGYTGDRCERCVSGYFGIPTIVGETCKPCLCNGNSRECDASGKCLNCQFHSTGDHCELCMPGYYGDPIYNKNCQSCSCDIDGSIEQQCDRVSGQCNCRSNLIGRQCDECIIGYYFDRSVRQCIRCNCGAGGSVSKQCNDDGNCICKTGVVGKMCDQCDFGYFGLGADGCKKCDCGYTSGNCNAFTGECLCPPNTKGPYCNQCVDYAFGWDKQKGCELCQCSSKGSVDQECDVVTGECTCKEEYQGPQCDMCRHGYFNFPHCTACFCNIDGTEISSCTNETEYGAECSCSNKGSCDCKENVVGPRCDQCAEGSFSLTQMNPKGCTECFCFGVTNQCRQADYYWGDVVSLSVNPLHVMVSNKVNTRSTSEGIIASASTGSVQMNASLVKRAMRYEPYYWRLPPHFNGDKLLSYGGNLKFTIYYNAQGESSQSTLDSAIVVLRGRGRNYSTISYNTYEPTNHVSTSYVVKMIESGWTYLDTNIPVTREDFAKVLHDIGFFLIRASYGTLLDQSRLSDVFLDVGVYGSGGRGDSAAGTPALGIEECVCPPGYIGLSCQDCDYGYTRTEDGKCLPCDCNNKSNSCNIATGKCYDCKDNFTGNKCERCVDGYYMTTDLRCLKCECPLPNIENNFSPTCHPLGSDGVNSFVCDNCPVGYEGQYCDICSEGYYGNPRLPGSYCRKCSCNSAGSLSPICDQQTGQCQCKPGITGLICDQCRPKHVITEDGCAVCDDECSGKLINELEDMTNQVSSIDLDVLFPPPWGRLNDLENITNDLERELDTEMTMILDNTAIVDKLPKKIEDFKMKLSKAVNKSQMCYLIADDMLYKANKTNRKLDRTNDTINKLLEDSEVQKKKMADLLDSVENGTGIDISMAEAIVLDLMKELRERNLEIYKSIAEDELREANELMDRVNKLFADPAGKIKKEHSETRIFVNKQLDDLLEKRSELFALLLNASANENITRNLNEMNAISIKKLKSQIAKLDSEFKMVLDLQENIRVLIKEIEKLLESASDELAKENELSEKLRAMEKEFKSAAADKVVGANLADLRRLVIRADNHATDLEEDAYYFKKVASDVSGMAFNETEAALRYVKIVNAMAEANKSANEAANAAMDAMMLAQGDLRTQSNNAKKRSDKLLDEVRQQGEVVNDDRVRLDELLEQLSKANNQTKDMLKKAKRFHRRLKKLQSNDTRETADKAIKVANEAIDTADMVMDGLAGVEDTIADLKDMQSVVAQQGNVIKAIEENVDKVPDLLEDTASVIVEAMNKKKNVDLLSETVQDKIKDVRKLIEESRKKASEVRVSIKSENECALRYEPQISPSLKTELTLHVHTAVPNNMLFYLAKDKGDYMSIESIDGMVNATINLGDGPISLINPVKIVETIEKDWYKIDLLRDRQKVDLVVTRLKETNISETVSIDVPGSSSYLDVNEQDVMFVGGMIDSAMLNAPVTYRKFNGCMGEATLQGKTIGLWNFREISAVKSCMPCVESPDRQINEEVYTFDGESYVIYGRSSRYVPVVQNIQFLFKTFSNNSLIIYDASKSSNDFLSLELMDGKLFLQIDLGNGINSIKTPREYNTGKWVETRIQRKGKILRLSVREDGKAWKKQIEIQNSDESFDVTAEDMAVVGGYPPTYMAKPTITKTFFIGCIKSYLVYDIPQPLIGKPLKYLGVRKDCPQKVEHNIGIDETGHVSLPGNDLTADGMISMTFNTKEPNALLLLAINDQKSRRRRKKRQADKSFYSLSLVNGYLHAWLHSTNGHKLNLTSQFSTYANGADHSVVIKRNGESLSLNINDGRDLSTGTMQIDGRPIRATTMYIGGVPNANIVMGTAASDQSLNGCIRELYTDRLVNFLNATSTSGAHFGVCRALEHDMVVLPTPSQPPTPTSTTRIKTRSTTLPVIVSSQAPIRRVYPDCKPQPDNKIISTFATHFGRSEHSHVQFAFNKKIGQKFRIELSIRTFAQNGLVLYCGHDSHSDFFSLQINDGVPVFQFDNGGGTAMVAGKSPINNGKWHTIRITRCKRRGAIYVDEVKQGSIRSPKGQSEMNIVGILYVGGIPSSMDKSKLKNMWQSIEGCIKDLSISRSNKLDFGKAALKLDVEPCQQYVEPGASFSGNGYAVYKPDYRVGPKMLIEFEFRTWVADAVLISVSNKTLSDGLAIEIVNGTIVFRADNGAGNFVTRYVPKDVIEGGVKIKENLCDGRWHKIIATKATNTLTLSVDLRSAPEIVSPSLTSSADTLDPLYIGGLPGNADLQAQLTTKQSFQGCLRDVKLKGQQVDFAQVQRKNISPSSCATEKG